ncbi:MAG: PilN domain-containing protein [Syntrophobacterales bacterium]|nr:MAG: PilN domain-containing protein [Syntrophobacterales bacterium]
MIRINLLMARAVRRGVGLRRDISIFVFVLILLFLLIGLMQWVYVNQSSELQTQISDRKVKLEKLRALKRQIDKYKANIKLREKRLAIIAELKKNKARPVRILDALSTNMPEKMCLRSLKKEGARMEMGGWALDDEVIANFMTKLQSSKYFGGVELIVTERFKPEGTDINIKKFTITSNVVQ